MSVREDRATFMSNLSNRKSGDKLQGDAARRTFLDVLGSRNLSRTTSSLGSGSAKGGGKNSSKDSKGSLQVHDGDREVSLSEQGSDMPPSPNGSNRGSMESNRRSFPQDSGMEAKRSGKHSGLQDIMLPLPQDEDLIEPDAEALLRSDEGNRVRKMFAWVEAPAFSGTVLTVLLLNAWALAMETDHPSWPWWRMVNGTFLTLFILEYVFRMLHRGVEGMVCGTGSFRLWMIYDLVCIICGMLDFVASCLFYGEVMAQPLAQPRAIPEDSAQPMAAHRPEAASTIAAIIIRGLMLSRLLRIVRILRLHGPLYAFVKLLLRMLNTYVWILSIIFVLCFVMAIVMTGLVTHGFLVQPDNEEASAQITLYFADVPKSLFTLFQLTTAQDWSDIKNPMTAVFPASGPFFIFFIVFMSWTMLSLLTAVASETMISATSNRKEQEALEQEAQRRSFSAFLCEEFLKADTDGNRVLDKEEFAHLMSQPQMMQCMKAHDIHLQDTDLRKLWDTFDIDESGELDIDELVTGFSYMQENLAMKHVANVCYSLKHLGTTMETNIDKLQSGVDELTMRQTHTGSRVLDDLTWQHQRWALFHSGDIEELDESSEVSSRAPQKKESLTMRTLQRMTSKIGTKSSRRNSKGSSESRGVLRVSNSGENLGSTRPNGTQRLAVPMRISRSSSSLRSPSSSGSK